MYCCGKCSPRWGKHYQQGNGKKIKWGIMVETNCSRPQHKEEKHNARRNQIKEKKSYQPDHKI
jgi:hypothetical protein